MCDALSGFKYAAFESLLKKICLAISLLYLPTVPPRDLEMEGQGND